MCTWKRTTRLFLSVIYTLLYVFSGGDLLSNIYDIKKHRRNPKKRFYYLGIILIFIMMILGITFSPIFKVSDVEVTGNKLYTKDEIVKMLNLNEGNNIFYLLTKDIKQQLKKYKKIEDVKVDFIFPNKIRLNVIENPPLGYVCQGNNYIYIDKNGVVIDISDNAPRDIPIITGLGVNEFELGKNINIEDNGIFEDLNDLIIVLKKHGLTKNKIVLDIANKFDIHIYINNIDVKFQTLDKIDEKVSKLAVVLNRMPEKNRGTIDLSTYKDKIVFSPME